MDNNFVGNSDSDGYIDLGPSTNINISSEVNTSNFIYKCNNCNSSFVSKSEVNTCIYCGNNIEKITNNQINNSYFYIPFSVEESTALRDYKKKVKFNPIIPIIFKKKKTIKAICKCYLPVNIYNINVNGNVLYLGVDVKNNSNDKKNKYLKSKYEVSTTANFDYNNLSVCTYSKINDELFNKINDYDYSKITSTNQFDDNIYILEDNSDVNNKLNDKIINHSIGMIRDNINHDKKKISTNGLNITYNSINKVYVPVYLLNISYKNNNYLYIMNGTNKVSSINIPISKKNIIICSLIIFIIIFLIVLLIAYMI
jgi:hypothetical protein